MEERKYTFYDRYQKVRYESVTAEELEVLNASYNKEHYMFHQQHKRNNTLLFCGMQTETSSAEDFLTDMSFDVAGDVANETAEELGISYRQASRDKNSALAKMLKRMKAAGYDSYAEASSDLLQEHAHIPTQLETQNSIMKRRSGEVRLPSDHKENK